jgi:serine protease Do
VGHPYGYRNTVSTGIISALDREVDVDGGPKLTNLIQTSAPINPGNSGGPLLNINGELIGIVVAMRNGAQGIAFALNADNVQALLAQHLSAKRIAHVGHGLTCREDLADGAERQQVVVEKVASQSPAAAAGLKRGDVVVTVGNRSVTNRFDLERSLWGYKAGDKVETTIRREGQVTSVALTLVQSDARQVGALPEAEQPSRGDGSVVAVSHQVSSLLRQYQPAALEVLKAVSKEIPILRNSRLDSAIAIGTALVPMAR